MTALTDSVRIQVPVRGPVQPAAALDPPVDPAPKRPHRWSYGYGFMPDVGAGSYKSWERAVGAARLAAENTRANVRMVSEDSGEMWNISPDGRVRKDSARSHRVPKAATLDAEMDRRADERHPRIRQSATRPGSTRRFSSFAALEGLHV